MNPGTRALLWQLQDGELHSGQQLADELGLTRAAIWKMVGELREAGVEVQSGDRKGYRLPRPVEMLDEVRIREAARRCGLDLAAEPELVFEIDSTNAHLQEAPPPAVGEPRLLIAEIQHAGRGRRGRSWVAPFGSGLTLSIAWTFAETPAELSSLSLAMGVAVVRCLRELGASDAMLKWPNDILLAGRKLGGLLIQVRSESGAGACAVVGLGLNFDLPQEVRPAIEESAALPVADLSEAPDFEQIGRNELLARLAVSMLDALRMFSASGYAPFAEEWARYDSLRNRAVVVEQGDKMVGGIARGADHDGSLQLEVDGKLQRFFSGDVSLRPLRT
jgi:BirA family biotin operon repressor/biotin-[acetyl-CoA-carboxylase] ligase